MIQSGAGEALTNLKVETEEYKEYETMRKSENARAQAISSKFH